MIRLSVHDNGQEIARYCGSPHVEFPLLSSSNGVRVNFVSDEKYEGKLYSIQLFEKIRDLSFKHVF